MIFAKPASKYNNLLLLIQQGLLHGKERDYESCMPLKCYLPRTKQSTILRITLKIYRSFEYTSTKEQKEKSIAEGDKYPQVRLRGLNS